MSPEQLKRTRKRVGGTQTALALSSQKSRLLITRDETEVLSIPQVVEMGLVQLSTSQIPLVGIVAAGEPIEPITQMERVEVPKSMLGRGETFALRVKGTSMRDDGILPGDVVVVQKQSTARNGQTIIALINGDATIKIYHSKSGSLELHPSNDTMEPIIVKSTDTFQIQGVVVGVIRHLKK